VQVGRTDEAISQYLKALEINPNEIHALINLAGAYYATNQLTKAVPLMQKALEIAKAKGDTTQIKDIVFNITALNKKIRSTKRRL